MSYRPIGGDPWWLARCKYKGGVKRYGGFPGGFLERARALLGVSIDDPVLHVCGGLSRLYPYAGGFGPNDCTLDLDPATQPDFLQDVRAPLPRGFKAMLADPPYGPEEARQYRPGEAAYPKPMVLLRNMLEAVEPGRRVGFLHVLPPQPPKGTRFIACTPVLTGFNQRVRVYSVYERGGAAIAAVKTSEPAILPDVAA
jgi:hypothetical protein